MKILSVSSLAIPEIKVIQFGRFSDIRGYFTEPYRRSDFENHIGTFFMKGIEFVQQNESFSKRFVLRGLHFQWNPYMGKLVRTIQGHMLDIFCDIRKGSPTYGKAAIYDMPMDSKSDTSEWIWIPPGFAHGNLFLDPTTIEYLCSGEYSQGCEAGISPLSTDLDWSLCDKVLYDQFVSLISHLVISDKDKLGLSLDTWTKDQRSDNFIYGQV